MIHARNDAARRGDANLFMCAAMTLEEWRERWGCLNPAAYATLPPNQIAKRRFPALSGPGIDRPDVDGRPARSGPLMGREQSKRTDA